MGTRELARGLGIAAIATLASACAATTRLGEPEAVESVRAVLDASSTTVWPGKRVKYWVDIENLASGPLEVTELSIELVASRASSPDSVALRRTWGYRWPHEVSVAPGRKLTTPIVPEMQRLRAGSGGESAVHVTSEFAVDQLAPGPYLVRAIVNGTHVSNAYALEVKPPPMLGNGVLPPLR